MTMKESGSLIALCMREGKGMRSVRQDNGARLHAARAKCPTQRAALLGGNDEIQLAMPQEKRRRLRADMGKRARLPRHIKAILDPPAKHLCENTRALEPRIA